jgi:hypothetical protein
VPLVQVLGGLERTDNTAYIRLHPDDAGSERIAQVGGAPVQVSPEELRNIASNYEVVVLEDDVPVEVETETDVSPPAPPAVPTSPPPGASVPASPLSISSAPSPESED